MKWRRVCDVFLSLRGPSDANLLVPELNNRASFVDFCSGLLDLNPVTRWTPQQARLHPFIAGEKFTKPFRVSKSTMSVVLVFLTVPLPSSA